ncbi:MAG: hypothetical protein K2L05_00035 [Muribaculaceae bacterium]|nr:hypothetical protein [Muribaculaceae bacterium]
MDIKNTLQLNYIDFPFNQWKCIFLNMSIRSLFDAVCPNDDNFYQNLSALGIELNAPIIASPQDVKDYIELDSMDFEESGNYSEADKRRLERLYTLINILSNLIICDVEFIDDETGKRGLKDPSGNIVVPALFDSCRGADCMYEITNYVVVEKNGKFYRTQRNGSGQLIDQEGYDKIYSNGEVICGNKYGMISLKTPDVLIPCEMDWIAYDSCFSIIFGKDGKIGMRDSYLHEYIAPEYSAFDISTLRFCRNGVWGWVSRKTGEFFTEPTGDRYDVMILACDAANFLNFDDKPDSKQKEQYLDIESVELELHQNFSKFKSHLKSKLSTLIDLPSLRFSKEFIAPPRILNAIHSLSLANNELVIRSGNNNAPDIYITMYKNDAENAYRLKWSPKDNTLAWYDTELQEITAFHQLIIPHKDTFSLLFYRDFTGQEIESMAKFIAHYYATIWNVPEEKLLLINATAGK